MAVVRRVLTLLIAAALALAPLGAASAAGATHARAPMVAAAAATSAHHDHGAMHTAATQDDEPSKPCKHESGTCCCDDKAACAQTCLAKCFGQMAVLADARTTRHALPHLFADAPTERPPDWAATPHPPPPRA